MPKTEQKPNSIKISFRPIYSTELFPMQPAYNWGCTVQIKITTHLH